MTKSLIQFTKEFEKLQSIQTKSLPDEYKLIAILNFWEDMNPVINNDIYQSYVQVYKQNFYKYLTENSIYNVTIEELKKLLAISKTLQISEKSNIVIRRIVTLLCYVGEFKQSIEIYNNHFENKISISIDGNIENRFTPFERLELRIKYLSKANVEAYNFYRSILDEWESKCEKLSNELVNCILVEKDKDSYRGKLCELKCNVELLSKRVTEDKISLNDKLKSHNDPYIEVIFNSISIVKSHIKQFIGNKSIFLHSHLNIMHNTQEVTGDSIGLASAAVMYTNLIKDEVQRYERFLSGEVVLTGSLDKQGNVLPINEDTLLYKIERIFFSHINYLVLPESNYEKAKQIIEKLNNNYPNRKLFLHPVENFSDILRTKDITRSEKVCIGEIAAKTIYKYSKMTKVQIPILVALVVIAGMLLIQQFPKVSPWFDWSPQYLQITENGFEALNADSLFLWEVEMDCPIEYIYSYAIDDIDNDGLNEVAYSPSQMRSETCQSGGYLFLYDDNGDELWSSDAVIYNEYPAKNSSKHEYALNNVKILKVNNSFQILTAVSASHPSTTQIRLWSISGESLSWYINSGSSSFTENRFYQLKDKLFIFCGINNNIHSAVLYVLDAQSFEGISPSYDVFESYDIDIIKGNQIQYVKFPQTDISLVSKERYNAVSSMVIESPNKYWINVNEQTNMGDKTPTISYLIDSTFRVQNVRIFDQFVITRDILVSQGLLPEIDWDEYREERLLAVEYWNDSCFVTERELRALENKPQ